MSHNHNGLALIELIQVLHDASLIIGIERVCSLVKEDVVRILVNRPCNQDTLFLSLAQSHAITPNLGVELQRQSHHVILDASYLGSFQQPFLIYIAIINSNVSCDTLREDNTILHDNTTLSAPPLFVELVDVSIAYVDLSLQDGIITKHQTDEGGLSTARCTNDGDYDSQLNIAGDSIMGYVEIPKIQVLLPIYHGTKGETLERGVGHLLGSSLPVGGESTHTILSGHSGMASQKMFTDLGQLVVGDVFYLHVLNETLAYQVVEYKAPVSKHF